VVLLWLAMDLQVGNKPTMQCLFLILGLSILAADGNRDPSFEFNFSSSEIYVGEDSVGSFYGTIYNLSSSPISLAVVRRINLLPNNWTSSICLGTICYFESIDSVSIDMSAEDSIACGLLAWIDGAGQGTVQLDIFDLESNVHQIVDVNFFVGNVGLSEEVHLINRISLLPSYPNPFNPITSIRFNIPFSVTAKLLSLKIYDITGHSVDILVDGLVEAGFHELQWNASNQTSGVYFVELLSGKNRYVQKLVLVK